MKEIFIKVIEQSTQDPYNIGNAHEKTIEIEPGFLEKYSVSQSEPTGCSCCGIKRGQEPQE